MENRPGDFTAREKNAMQISHQTLTGLRISVASIVGCTRFLLDRGMPFVLTNVFNQDPLEGLVGHYRTKGGSNDNPTVYGVGQTLSSLRPIGSQAFAPICGNTKRGAISLMTLHINNEENSYTKALEKVVAIAKYEN